MNQTTKNKTNLFEEFPDIMTVPQVSQALGVGRAAVYKLIGSKSLKYVRIGNAYRIPKTALISFLEESCSIKKGAMQQ